MSSRPWNKSAVERVIRIVATLAVVSVMSLALMLVLSSSSAAHAGVADANLDDINVVASSSAPTQAESGENVPAWAVRAQAPLLDENFDYGTTAMSLTTASGGNWVAHSGAGNGPVQYITTSLAMSGYGSSGVGGAATIATTGSEDVNRSFVAQTSGTVYFAALVNVSAAGTGDYFLHLKDATTGFRARVFARDESAVLRFGLATTGTATYSTATFSYNTTYLVVGKYTVNTGDTALYVLDTFSASEPATSLLSMTTGTALTVQGIAIRQGSSGARPAATIDGVRVANTWEDVVGAPTAPEADLGVAKSGPATASAGDSITYTIYVSNTGNTTATTTILTDTFPVEVSFVTYTTASPVVFTQASATELVWELGDVAAATAPLSIQVQGVVSSSVANGTRFTNTVTASTAYTETSLDNNTAQVATLVGSPDLVVVKDGPASVNAGDTLTFTLTYSNAGDLQATGVMLTDQLPMAMSYLTNSQGTVAINGGTVTWEIGDLDPGEGGSIVLTTTALYAGTYANRASMSSSSPDSNLLNNVSVFTTTILGADPFATKSGPEAAFRGERITYTVVYGNLGSAPVDVTLTDTLPISFTTADIAYDDSGLNPIDDTNTRTWTATLSSGARFTYTLALTVPTGIASNTRITNTIAITGTGFGSNPIDDLASASSTVYQIVPIATARAGSVGLLFAVRGTVSAEPGIFKEGSAPTNRKLYMQDATGGILVYRAGGLSDVARSHEVLVVGAIDAYRTETELVPANATDVIDQGPGTPISPIVAETGAVTESLEGQLVQVAGTVVGKPASYRLQVDDGSGVVEIYRYYNLGQTTDPNYIDFDQFQVGDYIRATGESRGYDYSGTVRREILPRGSADVAEYPRVLSFGPANGAVDIAVNASLTATFNMTMTNVDTTTFLLQGPSGAVAGTVTYDSASKTATFTPGANLAFVTQYTAVLKSGLQAYNGLSLMPMQDVTWTFTTRQATPNLSTSTKTNAINGPVRSGDLVTYTISLINSGDLNATARITDVLPSYYTVVNVLDFTQPTTGTLTWTGVVTAGQTVNVQFVARVKPVAQLPIGLNLLFNSATVNDGLHPTFTLDDPTPPMITIYGVYLPLIRR